MASFVDMRPFKPSDCGYPPFPGEEWRSRDFDSSAASRNIFIVDAKTTKHLFDAINDFGIDGTRQKALNAARTTRFPYQEMVIDFDSSLIEDEGIQGIGATRFVVFVNKSQIFMAAYAEERGLVPMPVCIDLTVYQKPRQVHFAAIYDVPALQELFVPGNPTLIAASPHAFMAMFLLVAFDSGFVGATKVPARSFMRGNKRVAVPATTSVTIRLWDRARKAIIRSLETHGHHATPRLHGVRGHWMHYDWIEHEHEWVDVPSTDGKVRQVCSCGARRTWRAEFERGDPSKGEVSKVYKVTSDV